MKSEGHFYLADSSSLDRILPLFRAYQHHYQVLTSASEEQTRAFLKQFLTNTETGFVVVAEIDRAIVGFATGYFTVSGVIAERLVHLGDLYVAPDHRSQGIATSLVHRVADVARQRGVKLVRWLSLAANTGLNRWYESLGATSGEFKLFFLDTTKTEKASLPS